MCYVYASLLPFRRPHRCISISGRLKIKSTALSHNEDGINQATVKMISYFFNLADGIVIYVIH